MVHSRFLIIWWKDGPEINKITLFTFNGLEIREFKTITQMVL